jgi:hypothetical protein
MCRISTRRNYILAFFNDLLKRKRRVALHRSSKQVREFRARDSSLHVGNRATNLLTGRQTHSCLKTSVYDNMHGFARSGPEKGV